MRKISLDEFSRWKVDELRKYLSLHGQSTTKKRKPELVSLAYAVSEQGLPIVPSTTHRVEQTDIDYRDLLKEHALPDPKTLVDGWIGEASGISRWPPCSYVNIANFMFEWDEGELLSRLGNDYKEGILCMFAHLGLGTGRW